MKAIFIRAIYVRKVSCTKKDPDTHVEDMRDVTTKENYQKCIKISGKRKRKNTKRDLQINTISPFLGLGQVPSGQCKF